MGEVADYSRGEPKPVPNDGTSMHDLVLHDINRFDSSIWSKGIKTVISERKQFGLDKYQTPLQAFNGRNALKDLQDEIGDALVYHRQLLEENVNSDERTLLFLNDQYYKLIEYAISMTIARSEEDSSA